jgi:hypothetical protein
MNRLTNPENYNVSEDKKDALEAFNSFNGARNLLFWLFLLIPLLVAQAGFWTVQSGRLDQVLIVADDEAPAVETAEIAEQPKATEKPETLENKISAADDAADDKDEKTENITPEEPSLKSNMSESLEKLIQGGIKTSNYILTFVAVIYCLVLLIGMKLSLVGQLGGLADTSKAFFLSLIVMVLILPWQHTISSEIHGTLFTYKELTNSYLSLVNSDDPKQYALYYGRFVGLWGLTMLLLVAAQWRSHQAVRKIRRRLTSTTITSQVVGEISTVGQQEDNTLQDK